ncbi:MAG: ATP-binding protein, partial [Fuerstiella sp.]
MGFGRTGRLQQPACKRFRETYESAAESRFRFLPILGPSGCGKSSLARAGLIAELARRPLAAWEQ